MRESYRELIRKHTGTGLALIGNIKHAINAMVGTYPGAGASCGPRLQRHRVCEKDAMTSVIDPNPMSRSNEIVFRE
jgi:hypothetical protein